METLKVNKCINNTLKIKKRINESNFTTFFSPKSLPIFYFLKYKNVSSNIN